MGDVIAFRPVKKAGKSSILCREGHHRWEIDNSKPFDPRSGKLVTLYRCKRCGKTRTRLL